MRVPDSSVPIRGFRVWGVNRDGLLESATAGFSFGPQVWRPFERYDAACVCLRHCDDAPNPDHTCGIHAFADEFEALRWAGAIARQRPVVLGTVDLWGRVVECGGGWRAQHAYPASLDRWFVPRRTRRLQPSLDVLIGRYGLAPVAA
jgi:hypothetical protein